MALFDFLKDTPNSETDAHFEEVREAREVRMSKNNNENDDLILTSQRLEKVRERLGRNPVTPAMCGDCSDFLIKKGWIGCKLTGRQWRELEACPLKDRKQEPVMS